MSGIEDVVFSGLVFLSMVTAIAFVHELGHFLAARALGVRVEAFAVGFGREVIGYTDSRGTRWKLGLLPLGGYVKMFAEDGRVHLADGATRTPTRNERTQSYAHKSVAARAVIVVAGPFANLLFAVLLLTLLALATGRASGLDAIAYGLDRAVLFAADNLAAIAGLLGGAATPADMLGPVGIAGMSGESAAAYGIGAVVLLTALLSVNIGLINLLPIPVLDGGHLVFLALEGLRGWPLGPRLQRISALCGLTAILGLSVAATLNDLVRLMAG